MSWEILGSCGQQWLWACSVGSCFDCA